MDNYTFEQFWKDLDDGYEIKYTYMRKKYLLSKITSNSYFRKIIPETEKECEPKTSIVNLKTLKELFPFMENIEYII